MSVRTAVHIAPVASRTTLMATVLGLLSSAPCGASPIDTLPVAQRQRAACSIAAAVQYDIPANLMLAVAEQEGGRPGLWSPNTNGTYDVGSMQFNTRYLASLAQYGITPEQVNRPGCYSYRLAAWRIRQHLLNDPGDLWQRAANYHSRTPEHNARYRAGLIKRAARWQHWLVTHYRTQSAQ